MSWEPKWIVPVGNGCNVGVAIDDHCYIVLLPSYSTDSSEPTKWRLGSWIPSEVARFIGILSLLRTIEKKDEFYRQQFRREEN